MWNENDTLMELVEDMGLARIDVPAKCPVCNEQHVHFLMHRDEGSTDKGTVWIWCGSCKSYTHFSYFVPMWWENPDFIDINRLDSLVDYPRSLEDKIDKWVRTLLRKTRASGAE